MSEKSPQFEVPDVNDPPEMKGWEDLNDEDSRTYAADPTKPRPGVPKELWTDNEIDTAIPNPSPGDKYVFDSGISYEIRAINDLGGGDREIEFKFSSPSGITVIEKVSSETFSDWIKKAEGHYELLRVIEEAGEAATEQVVKSPDEPVRFGGRREKARAATVEGRAELETHKEEARSKVTALLNQIQAWTTEAEAAGKPDRHDYGISSFDDMYEAVRAGDFDKRLATSVGGSESVKEFVGYVWERSSLDADRLFKAVDAGHEDRRAELDEAYELYDLAEAALKALEQLESLKPHKITVKHADGGELPLTFVDGKMVEDSPTTEEIKPVKRHHSHDPHKKTTDEIIEPVAEDLDPIEHKYKRGQEVGIRRPDGSVDEGWRVARAYRKPTGEPYIVVEKEGESNRFVPDDDIVVEQEAPPYFAFQKGETVKHTRGGVVEDGWEVESHEVFWHEGKSHVKYIITKEIDGNKAMYTVSEEDLKAEQEDDYKVPAEQKYIPGKEVGLKKSDGSIEKGWQIVGVRRGRGSGEVLIGIHKKGEPTAYVREDKIELLKSIEDGEKKFKDGDKVRVVRNGKIESGWEVKSFHATHHMETQDDGSPSTRKKNIFIKLVNPDTGEGPIHVEQERLKGWQIRLVVDNPSPELIEEIRSSQQAEKRQPEEWAVVQMKQRGAQLMELARENAKEFWTIVQERGEKAGKKRDKLKEQLDASATKRKERLEKMLNQGLTAEQARQIREEPLTAEEYEAREKKELARLGVTSLTDEQKVTLRSQGLTRREYRQRVLAELKNHGVNVSEIRRRRYRRVIGFTAASAAGVVLL